MTEEFGTLEQYLKEKVSGEHIDVERETERHRQRFRENASRGDQFAKDIMRIDDAIESLPVEVNLAENFGIGNPLGFDSRGEPLLIAGKWVSESDVEKHIKEYYTKVGFGFSGYGALGFLDFRKGQEYLSVNLTWTPWNILVSVHDKSGRSKYSDC